MILFLYLINIVLNRAFKFYARPQEEGGIPKKWHQDPILSQFQCLILHEPIRYPVKDLFGKGLYEKAALIQWLAKNPTSPLTRAPTQWWEASAYKPYAIASLIQYRLEQLQHCGNAKDNALKLDQEVSHLLSCPLESLKKFPDFLKYVPKVRTCCLTGKVIRHIVIPNLSEKTLAMDPTLLDIFYEKDALKKHIQTNPNKTPPSWPIKYLPSPLNARSFKDDLVRQHDMELAIAAATSELSQFYTSFECKRKTI
jgi:hypothetical protein